MRTGAITLRLRIESLYNMRGTYYNIDACIDCRWSRRYGLWEQAPGIQHLSSHHRTVRNTPSFYIKMIILLRQARDKHRKHNDGEGVFCRNLFVRNGAVRFETRTSIDTQVEANKGNDIDMI